MIRAANGAGVSRLIRRLSATADRMAKSKGHAAASAAHERESKSGSRRDRPHPWRNPTALWPHSFED